MTELPRLSFFQQASLIALRTLIGWHFLYEGFYKLMLPGWGADGRPLPPWTSAGFLQNASGPLAGIFQRLVDAGWTPLLDGAVKLGLLAIGVSLILGLFTRAGLIAAAAMLFLFYVLAIPLAGSPQPGNEGTYLIVNKTLIEGVAVLALLAFDTGKVAGLDIMLATRSQRRALKQSKSLAKGPVSAAPPVTEPGTGEPARSETEVLAAEKPTTEPLKRPDFLLNRKDRQ